MAKMPAPDIPCPICKEAAKCWVTERDASILKCVRCGDFEASGSAFAVLRHIEWTSRQQANASGWIREHKGIQISSRDIPFLESLRTPTVEERAAKILLELERRSPDISTRLTFNFGDPSIMDWVGISWSIGLGEVQYLMLDYLHAHGHISGTTFGAVGAPRSLVQAGITPNGYETLGRLRQGGSESTIGFCAMWFAPENEPLWTEAFAPGIRNAGYSPIRIDRQEHTNMIDDEIIATIRRSKFLVSDFTGQRGGVYFESGFALGFGLRVIWTCRADELSAVHFDNRQYNFLVWEREKLSDLAKRLQNRIEATIGRGPLSVGGLA